MNSKHARLGSDVELFMCRIEPNVNQLCSLFDVHNVYDGKVCLTHGVLQAHQIPWNV